MILEKMMITEPWTKTERGVLYEEPLLLRANKARMFGSIEKYHGGIIHSALFTYLCGKSDEQLFDTNKELFRGWLVCMSADWEEFIRKYPLKNVMRRVMMDPRCGISEKTLPPLPDGYSVGGFTQEIFEMHPFGQAVNYQNYEDFLQHGAGVAVLFDGDVTAAASSFLTFGNDIELDLFTSPEHRRKGLADHCVSQLMRDCTERGLTVHWDAQNTASAEMALSHGFTIAQEYAVYELDI